MSDRLKVFAGQNEKMSVLSGSPALFAKTNLELCFKATRFLVSAKCVLADQRCVCAQAAVNTVFDPITAHTPISV